jgi:hypothetical protein
MSSVVVAAGRSAEQRTRVAIRLALLVALSLLAGCIAPRALRGRAPAPTLGAPDSPELAEALSGTLIAVRRHGRVTLVDLPSRREARLDLGKRVYRIAGPDESGRIVYEASNPRWWEFFPLTLFIDRRREALFVRSVGGGRARVLREYEPASYGTNLLQISRRGGRVVYAVGDDLRVYDVGGRELLRREFHSSGVRNARIDEDGAVLHFERIEPLDLAGATMPNEQRRWRPVSIDLSTGEERIESHAPAESAVAGSWTKRKSMWRQSAPNVAELLTQPRATLDPRGELPGDLGDDALEFANGATIYHGLANPEDGARAFRSYGPTEHSLRLGERSTGKTLNLVRRFEPGAWTFTDVRVDPKLLGEPAPLRR